MPSPTSTRNRKRRERPRTAIGPHDPAPVPFNVIRLNRVPVIDPTNPEYWVNNGTTDQPIWDQRKGRRWIGWLYRPLRYKVLYGGRGGGKTSSLAEAMIYRACAGFKQRMICAREFGSDHDDSLRQVLVETIERMGLTDDFVIPQRAAHNYIRHRHTQSEIFFRGLERNRASIKGWQSINVVWIDEAQQMSKRSWELLRNSVRAPKSEIWMSFNPDLRADAAWQFVISRPRNAYIRRVNWDENPFLPKELEDERQACLRDEPHRYGHVWLGEPDDDLLGQQILPYSLLKGCVRTPESIHGEWYGGLDVADKGLDFNALVLRRGTTVMEVHRWAGRKIDPGITASKAAGYCLEKNVIALYYDEVGVGASINALLPDENREYAARGVTAQAIPWGEKTLFSQNKSNKDMFHACNSQLAWNIRLRAQCTMNDGPEDYRFYINPNVERREEYLSELAQPVWREGPRGGVMIDKRGEEPGARSPDRFDATCFAFASDASYGIVASRYIDY